MDNYNFDMIKQIFIKNGFDHLRDPGHKNTSIDKVDIVDFLYDLSQNINDLPFMSVK